MRCCLYSTALASLQVCAPSRFAASIVHHPLRLRQLVSAFVEAFTFDASTAGMLSFATAEPSGSTTSYKAAAQVAPLSANQENSTSPSSEQHLAPGSQEAVLLLPRMPPGLALVTSTQTFSAVAAAAQAAAACAAAADAAGTGTALRSLVDSSLDVLRRALACASIAGMQQHSGRATSQPLFAGDVGSHGEAAVLDQAPWQLRAASAATLLAELVLGASPAGYSTWHLASSSSSSGGSTSELDAIALAVLQELVQEGVWSLPTGAAASDVADTHASLGEHLLMQASGSVASQQQVAARERGYNALLVKAALECCGAVARALGPRFAQNGRLLRATLLPMLEKLGESCSVFRELTAHETWYLTHLSCNCPTI